MLVSQATPELLAELYRDMALRKLQLEQRQVPIGQKKAMEAQPQSPLLQQQQSYQSMMSLGRSTSSRPDRVERVRERGSLDSPAEFMRILGYIAFIAVCLGFIVFLGYVIYSGITLSNSYLILVVVFAIVVVYICLRFRVPWCKNAI